MSATEQPRVSLVPSGFLPIWRRNPDQFVENVLTPALEWMDVAVASPDGRPAPKLSGREAYVLLLAIAHQESGVTHRCQLVGRAKRPAPHLATGLWQFERIGVRGVLENTRSAPFCRAAIGIAGSYPPGTVERIHELLMWNDQLAAVLARALLYTDPKPLPALTASADETFAYYVRNWRPGKPARERWGAAVEFAHKTVEKMK